MKNRKFIKIISFLLLISALFAVLTTSVFSYSKDYSESVNKVTLDAASLVELVTGETLHEIEREYLTLYGDFSFSYVSTLGEGLVTAVYYEKSESMVVTAAEYEYTALDGTKVIWKPISATYEGKTEELCATENNEYSVTLEDVIFSRESSVSVSYTSDFIIPSDELNPLLNLTYNKKEELKAFVTEKENEYKESLVKYNSDKKNYEDYITSLSEYELQKEKYNRYTVQMLIYEKELKVYEDYLVSEEKYKEELQKYNEYLKAVEAYKANYVKYQEYLSALEQMPAKEAAYNEYLGKMEVVKEHLAILSAIKTSSTSLDRNIYSAILGGTVDSVLENRDAIANGATGVDPTVVDQAGIATENLRKLFKEYFALKTEEDKYNYYILQKKSFADNFALLLQTLDRLYQSKQVCSELIRQEKHEKYVILLAQLYYITNALNEEPIAFIEPVPQKYYKNSGYYDSTYRIWNVSYNKKGTVPLDALEGVALIEDKNNSAPLVGGYPTPMEKPYLEEVAEPQMPTVVKEPIKPVVVEPPVMPEKVEEPKKPTEVSPPGEPPVPYTPSAQEQRLLDANLQKREELASPYVLSPIISLTESVSFVAKPETVTVIFYSYDGSVLYTSTVEKGNSVEYEGETPVREEDSTAKYVFAGWTDSPTGSLEVDLSEVNSDIAVYPKFDAIYKYTVEFFDVNGVLIYSTVLYRDSSIEYSGIIPVKPETPAASYSFIGWTDTSGSGEVVELGKATSDRKFYPVFDEQYKYYTVTFLVEGKKTEKSFKYGETPAYDSTPLKPSTSTHYYVFVGWDRELLPVTESATYTAVFEEKEIPKEPCRHTSVETLRGVLATCTQNGLTEGKRCLLCGEILLSQTSIDALGHKETILEAKLPTCTENGLTEGKKCDRCGEILLSQTSIDALGHEEVILEGRLPTCTEKGLTEGKKCDRCGEILLSQTSIDALGHEEVILEGRLPTCTEKGLAEGKKCNRCAEILIAQTTVDALGHNEVVLEERLPTCTEKGLTEGKKCDRCGEIFTAQTTVDALGHIETVLQEREESCSEVGLTEGKKCERCGEITVVQTEIPKLSHIDYDLNGKCDVCNSEVELANDGITFNNGIYILEAVKSEDGVYDISKLIDIAATRAGATVRINGVSVCISELDVKIAGLMNASSLKIIAAELENSVCTYTVSIFDKNGVDISNLFNLEILAPCSYASIDNLILVSSEGESETRISCELSDGLLKFNTNGKTAFRAYLECKVDLYPAPFVDIGTGEISFLVDKTTVTPGEFITLTVALPKGLKLVGAYYTRVGTSEPVPISPEGFFAPEYDITVGIKVEPIKYTVDFVMDGQKISTSEYLYGQSPYIPSDLKKADIFADGGKYTYLFIGWDKEVTLVTENTVYTAVFEESFEANIDDGKLKITPSVLKLLVTAAALLLCFTAVALPCLVLTVVLIVKHKRKFTKNSHK